MHSKTRFMSYIFISILKSDNCLSLQYSYEWQPHITCMLSLLLLFCQCNNKNNNMTIILFCVCGDKNLPNTWCVVTRIHFVLYSMWLLCGCSLFEFKRVAVVAFFFCCNLSKKDSKHENAPIMHFYNKSGNYGLQWEHYNASINLCLCFWVVHIAINVAYYFMTSRRLQSISL